MCTLSAFLRRQKFTEAQLRKAFAARRKPGWPSSYEAAMFDRFYALAIEAEARKQAAEQARLAKRNTPKAPVFILKAVGGIDLKRRASGEKDNE